MRACAAAARLADRALQPRLRRPFRRRAGSGAGDPTTAACGHPAREPHARRDAVTPPSVGALLRASFELYRRHVRLVLIVTVPIVILVTGLTALGLGELSARVRPAPPLRDTYIDLAASQLVTAPLITAILARLVVLTGRGETVSATNLVADALEVFPAVLLVIVAWLAASFLGFASLIVPGVYVFVSWYFVVQAVVIDGDRGFAPIRRSAGLVRGHWWQSAVIGVAFRLAALVPQVVI